MKKKPTILAWHFTAKPLKLRDGKPFELHKWVTRRNLEMCKSGLHASVKLIDALNYAPGPYLYRVECAGTIVHGNDKLVCSRRRALWGGDASEFLRRFALDCALSVVDLWDAPLVVRQYLISGDETLRVAAWDAAWAAAKAAARAAARAPAWAAAKDGAKDAANAAARAAACAAACAAARAAARAAANAAAKAAANAPAKAAANAPANAAARDAQPAHLDALAAEWAVKNGWEEER